MYQNVAVMSIWKEGGDFAIVGCKLKSSWPPGRTFVVEADRALPTTSNCPLSKFNASTYTFELARGWKPLTAIESFGLPTVCPS